MALDADAYGDWPILGRAARVPFLAMFQGCTEMCHDTVNRSMAGISKAPCHYVGAQLPGGHFTDLWMTMQLRVPLLDEHPMCAGSEGFPSVRAWETSDVLNSTDEAQRRYNVLYDQPTIQTCSPDAGLAC
eukprot:1800165-Amphidinium_carterae.1